MSEDIADSAALPVAESSLTDEERAELRRRAAENARRVREEEKARENGDLQDFARQMQELAAKATGKTVEELLAMAAEVEEEPDPEPISPFRTSREVVAARGVPELHLRHVYDVPPQRCDSLDHVRMFLRSGSTILVLAGGVGTRKSGSACWGLTQRAGRYITADDLSRLAASRDGDGVAEYRQVKKTELLVLDDLGGEYSDDKGWFVKVLTTVVDARYAACAKTIITTNLDADGFKRTYGERVSDRIREAGRFVDISGASVRRMAR